MQQTHATSAFEPAAMTAMGPQSALAPPMLPPVKQEPISLTGSVPKTPTGRRPSLDLEYELFRDSGGQVPELSQPAAHEFMLDMHGGGAVTPPLRSPTAIPLPPFGSGARLMMTPPHGMSVMQPQYPMEPRLMPPSGFAFPPQPHGVPLGSAQLADAATMHAVAQQQHHHQQQQQPQQQSQAQQSSTMPVRIQPARAAASALASARLPPPPSQPAAASSKGSGSGTQTPYSSSAPSSPESESQPEQQPPSSRAARSPAVGHRRKHLPAEEKAKIRAEQSRTSSRLYRQRKKAYQQTMEQELEMLKDQSASLKKELDAAKEHIKRLQEELASNKEARHS